MTPTIRILTADDAADFRDIRIKALQAHPEAFAGDIENEKMRTLPEWMEKLERDIFFGAFDGGKLVGMIGYIRYDGVKMRHSGKIISMYVTPTHRGQKVGDALIDAVVEFAREEVEQIYLSCATTNKHAHALYERNRFTTYGTEPRILKVGDTYYDEYLMVRDLRA